MNSTDKENELNIKNKIKNRLLDELKDNSIFKNIPELSHRSSIILFTLSAFDYGYDARDEVINSLKAELETWKFQADSLERRVHSDDKVIRSMTMELEKAKEDLNHWNKVHGEILKGMNDEKKMIVKSYSEELETARELMRESFCFLDFIIDCHDSLGQCREFKQRAEEFLKKVGE